MSKLVSKNSPTYFIQYGIDGDKFFGMYQALRDRGLNHYPAFMYSWQATKEVPTSYYAFGKKYNNIDDWANHSYEALTGKRVNGIYKNAQNATNYEEWKQAMKSFNAYPEYWNSWLKEGLDSAEAYINSRGYKSPTKESELPKIKLKPIVMEPDALKLAPIHKNEKNIQYFEQ